MKIIGLAIAAIVIAVGMPATPSEAHHGRGSNWFWHLSTYKNDEGKGPLDPLSIFWNRGENRPEVGRNDLGQMISQRWQGGGRMSERACLKTKHLPEGRQWSVFRSLRAGVGNKIDAVDWQMSTANCATQWHMRFWDDQEHADLAYGDTALDERHAQSGVHLDNASLELKSYGCCHRVAGYWKEYRHHALRRGMRSICTKSRWRRYPGGDRKFQGKSFDGIVGIAVATIDGNCPRGLR